MTTVEVVISPSSSSCSEPPEKVKNKIIYLEQFAVAYLET